MPDLTAKALTRRELIAGAAASAGAVLLNPGTAHAQAFPAKPITYVVALAPGSGHDAAGRLLGRKAGELLGAQVVIENRPGAGTMTASHSVVKAPADGYTLLQNGMNLSINPSLYKHVPYDAARDLVPVAFLVNAPMVIVINPSLGVTTVAEFVGKYKGSDHLTYGHPGIGSMPQLTAALFGQRLGVTMRGVPYRGGALALSDVIAGHIDMTVVTPLVRAQLEAGKVRALGVGAAERLETLPDVPTFAESGVPMSEFDAGAWIGVLAPAGTPDDVVRKLNGAFNASLADPAVKEELKKLGFVPRPMTPEQFRTFLLDDMKKWPPVIAAAGIAAE